MTTTRVPAPDLIMAALAQANIPLTVTELAEEAGVGRSTVSKYLPSLEKDGAALRTPGGREGRRRLPDHWQAAPTISLDEDTPANESTTGATEDLTGPDTTPPTMPEATVREQANPDPASDPSAPMPDASATPTRGRAHTGTVTDEEGVNPVSGSRRLPLCQGQVGHQRINFTNWHK